MGAFHVSIDDVAVTLQDCVRKGVPFRKHIFFKYLKGLNERYGLKVSLFIQNWSSFEECDFLFEGFDDAVAEWMRLGIHTTADGDTFDKLSESEARNEWERFVHMIQRNGGVTSVIDRFPRLHMFSGSKEALLGLCGGKEALLGLCGGKEALLGLCGGKEALLGLCGGKEALTGLCGGEIPIKGFLSADDDRLSYYFDEELARRVAMSGKPVVDTSTGIGFKSTDMRLDWFSRKFSSKYTYKKPVKRRPYSELKLRSYENSQELTAIFTHEWQLYRKGRLTWRRLWLSDVCKYAKDAGVKFEMLDRTDDAWVVNDDSK